MEPATPPLDVNFAHCGPKLAAALVKVQAGLKAARKVKENPHLRSKYADLAAVWEACHEALTANEVAVIQPFSFDAGQMFVETYLLHSSGEYVKGRYLVQPVKQDPQGFGSAGTYGRRYSLAAMVGIVQEDDDGNRGTRGGAPKGNTDKVKVAEKISAAERIALNKARLAANKTEDQVSNYLKVAYDVDSSKDLLKKDFEDVLAWIAEPKPLNKPKTGEQPELPEK